MKQRVSSLRKPTRETKTFFQTNQKGERETMQIRTSEKKMKHKNRHRGNTEYHQVIHQKPEFQTI